MYRAGRTPNEPGDCHDSDDPECVFEGKTHNFTPLGKKIHYNLVMGSRAIYTTASNILGLPIDLWNWATKPKQPKKKTEKEEEEEW